MKDIFEILLRHRNSPIIIYNDAPLLGISVLFMDDLSTKINITQESLMPLYRSILASNNEDDDVDEAHIKEMYRKWSELTTGEDNEEV